MAREKIGVVKGAPLSFNVNYVGTITNFSIDKDEKGYTIPFVFSPVSLTDNISANYQQTQIPGASAPQITYSSTGARQVSFTIDLPLDYLPPNTSFTDFEDYLNAFRALVYPKYSKSGGKVSSPHCQLNLSNIQLDGVCTSCNIEYKTDRIANNGTLSASVSLSFLEVFENVGYVDSEWIILGKTNVISDKSVTVRDSEAISRAIDESTIYVAPDDRCYITLKGNSTYSMTTSEDSLLDIINEGLWADPGCSYTNVDKYTIKKFWGYVRGSVEMNSITNIELTMNKYKVTDGTCYVNGKKTTLYTQCPNGVGFEGDILSYFIIYVPLYDGDKFEINSAKYRFVYLHITGGR